MNNLQQLEKKYQELGAEIERLKRPKTGKVLRASDLNDGDRYYFNHSSFTYHEDFRGNTLYVNRIKAGLAFYDEKSAINHREARLLAHECDIAIAESWDGEEIDWCDEKQPKFCFVLLQNKISTAKYLTAYNRFAFKEESDEQAFIDKHGEKAVINMMRNY